LEADLPDIERFENYVFEMESRLPEIHEKLEGTLSDANEAKGIVSKAQKAIPEAEDVVDSGLETINNTTDFLEQAENRLHELEPKIEEDLKKTQETAAAIHSFFDELDSTNISFEEGKALKEDIRNEVDDSIERIETVENSLEAILEQMKNDENSAAKEQIIQDALDKLNQITSVLEEGRNNTDEIDIFIDKKKEEVDHVLVNIKELSGNVEVRLGEFMKEYNESIKPTVLEEVGNAKSTLSDARGILVDVQSTIPEVENLLNRTSGSLEEGRDLLEEVLNEYPYVNDKINELAKKIRDIQGEADIQEIIELLQNDPEAERGFFAEPVKLNEHSVFPIENYGTGMTPFYTILSLWVGGLLLISLLTTDVHELDKFGAKEIYFGKLFTFTFIGFLQTFIVTTGDIFLINVEMAHPFWFVLFGLFCSFIFITIIYTFVSILGDVGKALAIVMLVLQIAGSGGTYPIVLLPKFFQAISPFLPF